MSLVSSAKTAMENKKSKKAVGYWCIFMSSRNNLPPFVFMRQGLHFSIYLLAAVFVEEVRNFFATHYNRIIQMCFDTITFSIHIRTSADL